MKGDGMARKNYYLDLVLLVSGLICIVTGVVIDFHLFSGGKPVKIILVDIHTYSGYVMLAGLVLHLKWHWRFIVQMTRQVFLKK